MNELLFTQLNEEGNIRQLLRGVEEQGKTYLVNLSNPELINSHIRSRIKQLDKKCVETIRKCGHKIFEVFYYVIDQKFG